PSFPTRRSSDLTNAYPIGFAEGLGTTFIDLALYDSSTRDWFALFKKVFSNPATLGLTPGFDYTKVPVSPAAGLKPEAYTGTYHNDYFGDVTITEQYGALAMMIGPRNKSFPLQHYGRD